jgi:HK97 family phage major capsid protein
MSTANLSLAEAREQLDEKRKELHKIFEEAGPNLDLSKVTVINGDNEYKASEVKRRNQELSELGQTVDRLALLEQIGEQNRQQITLLNNPTSSMSFPGSGNGTASSRKSQGDLKRSLLESKGYRDFRDNLRREVTLELPAPDFKTLITLSTVNAQADRRELVNMALEERTVADLMLQGGTDNNTIEYYEETTVTNAAATVAEGGTKPEAALAWTLRTESVRKIAVWLPATKESLDDVSWLESQIRGRLAFMVQRQEEAQILAGDGNAPNLRGILNRSGIQTQAKGADPVPDAIYRAMQKIRGAGGSGFAEPSAVVMHPNDWTDVKLLRTADGIYIWGNPSDEGPDRIWGLPVRQTTAMTENTALVGAFRPYAEVLRREGINITLSTEHGTYFVENKVAILAESRLALAVYRPAAFATVTGI